LTAIAAPALNPDTEWFTMLIPEADVVDGISGAG
jgi:hypothetical protein